jgi:Fur family peroxide stress response transcriptional regulator
MSKKGIGKSSRQLNERIHDFEAKCRRMGLKLTPQRIAVFKALLGTDQHPCAEQVLTSVREVFPNVSRDTIGRSLSTLCDMGVAFAVEGSGDLKRFDADMSDHQHFKCVKCKRIVDFHYKPFDKLATPSSISKKFTVLRKTVYFEGICDFCMPA